MKSYIKTRELLSNCVDWTLDPSDEVYEGAFDTLNTDTLEVEYNGVDIDWDVDDDGNIVFEDFTVREQYTLNKFVFTWTEAEEAVAPPAEVPWYEQSYFGIPLWLIIAIILVIVLIGLAISKQ